MADRGRGRPRKKSDTISFNLRMKEPLRAELERAAKNSGDSMNREIVNRLSASLDGNHHTPVEVGLLAEINERLIDLELHGMTFTAEPPLFQKQWEQARQRIKDRYRDAPEAR